MRVDSINQTHETWLSERTVAVIHPGDILICEQYGSTHGIYKKIFLSRMELEFWLEGGGIQKCKMIDPVHWSPKADVPEEWKGHLISTSVQWAQRQGGRSAGFISTFQLSFTSDFVWQGDWPPPQPKDSSYSGSQGPQWQSSSLDCT